MSTADALTTAVRDAWNGATGERWVRHAERFDALLEPMGTVLVDAARPRAGERILEVGCGTGQLAAAVGDRGAVVGVDVSAPMLAVAGERVGRAGLVNVDLVEDDAARVDLGPAGFDAVVSRFGVMFFGDPPAAFAHLGGLIRPGGRLSVVTWRPMPECEFFALPFDVLARHAPEALASAGRPDLPGPFSLSDPATIRSLADRAGLVDVEVTAVDRSLVVGRTVDEALAFVTDGSSFEALRDAGPEVVRRVEADLRLELADRLGPDGVVATGGAWLVTARRP